MLKRIPRHHREALTKLLHQIRVEKGLNQTELAEKLDRPQNFVSLYERGVRRLDLLEVREICKALSIPLVTFIRRLEKSL